MSSDAAGLDVDLDEALTGDTVDWVSGGTELVAFAEAAAAAFQSGGSGEADSTVATARDALRAIVGDEAVVEAAATIAIFNGLVRVADATGIELDPSVVAETSDFRDRLGLDDYQGATNTRDLGDPASALRAGNISELFG